MEKKINYLDYQLNPHFNHYNHQIGMGVNQMFEQQFQSKSGLDSKNEYQYYANSQESYNNNNNIPQLSSSTSAPQPTQIASSSHANSYCSNFDIFSTPKPYFHSPQINNLSKCQLSSMKLTFTPNKNTIHLQPQSQSSQPKHSYNFHQIEQISSFPQLNLKQTSSTCSAESNYVPCPPSFDTDSLYTSEESCVKNNKTQRRSFQASSYSNYFQRTPFINQYTKNLNAKNNFKQNQSYTYPNNCSSLPNHQMKNKHRKQSFNSSTSTCDDSQDYQFRARAGSYQSSLNNQFNNPNKMKQIEERCSKKLKRTIKHYTKQNTVQFGALQYDNQLNLFDDQGMEELHESDNHRITNEDLITTHQEQMKEELNHKDNNKDENNNDNNKEEDELNISEKEEELENLDEITLESAHKQNYGCSMIDKILDEWSNEEDQKLDKLVSSVLTNNVSQSELEYQSSTQLESKTDIEKEIYSKNTEFEKSYFSKCIPNEQNNNNDIQNSDICQEEIQQQNIVPLLINENENIQFVRKDSIENNKNNQESLESIMSQESVTQQKIMYEEQSKNSSMQMKNEECIECDNSLNLLLDQANLHMQNPLALFEIVQKLAQQIRDKDSKIRNLEIENYASSIKSLTSINFKSEESDSQLINSGLKKLTLEETKQQQQY